MARNEFVVSFQSKTTDREALLPSEQMYYAVSGWVEQADQGQPRSRAGTTVDKTSVTRHRAPSSSARAAGYGRADRHRAASSSASALGTASRKKSMNVLILASRYWRDA
jgi:hypothetical protein